MATLAETVLTNNTPPTQGVDIAGSLNEGVKAGIQLATAAEQVQEKKQQVEMQKLQIDQAKFTAFDTRMKTLNRAANPAVRKAMAVGMKNQFQQYGFDPVIVDLVVADPETGRLYQNMSEVLSGKLLNDKEGLADALSSFQNAGMFAEGMEAIKMAITQANEQKKAAADESQFTRELQSQEKRAAMQVEAAKKRSDAGLGDDLRIANSRLTTLINPTIDALEKLNKVDSFLDSGGLANTAAQRELAMTFNKGALSESDAKLFEGNRSLMERFQQMMTMAYDGKLTEDNKEEMRQIVKVSRESANKRVKATVEDHSNAFSKAYGIPIEKAREVFTPVQLMKMGDPQEKTKPGDTPAAQPSAKIPESKIDELVAKRAAQNIPGFDPAAYKAVLIKKQGGL